MASNKTQPTRRSVSEFLDTVEDPARRADCRALRRLMEEATGEPAVLWGSSIVGFGSYHYVYASGREGDWLEVGFSPRKRNLTVYLMSGVEREAGLLAELGPHKTGKSCLYIKRLENVDTGVLRKLVDRSVGRIREGDISY